jgi:hypothetical protein
MEFSKLKLAAKKGVLCLFFLIQMDWLSIINFSCAVFSVYILLGLGFLQWPLSLYKFKNSID